MSSTLPKSVQASMSSSSDNRPAILNQNALAETNPREFVMKIKDLPDDFLRLPNVHRQVNQYSGDNSVSNAHPQSLQNLLEISIIEATLVKNYGLLRMDLYCKIRVGHIVYETQTCQNGAKNPKWSGVYQFNLKPGITSFSIDIYDEKQFSADEKVAWLHETIPPEVYQGQTIERWFPLSGRYGVGREGTILLVLSLKRVPAVRGAQIHNLDIDSLIHQQMGPNNLLIHQPAGAMRGVPIDPNTHVPVYVQPEHHPPAPQSTNQPHPNTENPVNPPIPITEEDITQLSEMFPSIDKAIIRAVLENNRGDKEASISFLLVMG